MSKKSMNKGKPKKNKMMENGVGVGVHPMLTSPKIDKISLVVDMVDKGLHGQLIGVVLGWFENKDPAFIKGKWSVRYPLTVSILCPNADGVFEKDGPAVTLQATKKEWSVPQVRIEFNPAKLFGPMASLPIAKGNPCKEYLDIVFTELCGVSFFEFLYHARVTSMDVCREILWHKPDDFMFKVRYAQTSQSWFGKSGKLETLYFGKSCGNQTRVYNKAKEAHGAWCGHDCVRIEVRQRFKDFKIQNLWDVPNPFKKVGVYSLVNATPPYGVAHWVAFQDSCRFRGIGNAIKLQPKGYQHKLKKLVSELPVTWWQMCNDDWSWLLHEALENGGLSLLPDTAPALTIENATGGKCLQKAA